MKRPSNEPTVDDRLVAAYISDRADGEPILAGICEACRLDFLEQALWYYHDYLAELGLTEAQGVRGRRYAYHTESGCRLEGQDVPGPLAYTKEDVDAARAAGNLPLASPRLFGQLKEGHDGSSKQD